MLEPKREMRFSLSTQALLHLDDLLAVQVITVLPGKVPKENQRRKNLFPTHFDSDGDVRTTRVLKGWPVIVKANERYWFPGYKLNYVFIESELVKRVPWKLYNCKGTRLSVSITLTNS